MTPGLGAMTALVVVPLAIMILAVLVYRLTDSGRSRRR
jgi:hypothetical protein